MGSGVKKLKDSSLILADELHQPVIKRFNKRKVYSKFKDNIWGVDLADMQSLSKKNKGIKYLLCAIDLYSKYAFVISLKDKKGISITNAFDKIIKQSKRKIWVKYKIDTVDQKIPDISELATKTSLNAYLQTATSNSKVTEVENKIKATDIIAKSANTKANTIRRDLTSYAKKADDATDITAIENDYVTNASLTSQLNDLKSQHIATEVTAIDNKAKKKCKQYFSTRK